MLETSVRGRTVRAVALSGLPLRRRVPREVPRALAGRTLRSVGRHGKVLLLGFDGGMTLVSHLGMSGRWLFFPDGRAPRMPHVHARVRFTDGSRLWFQDTRRFGLLRAVPTASLARDPALRGLGPDPMAAPPRGADLRVAARGLRVAIKPFLLDQRRVAGVGNIYADEALFRARIHPLRPAGTLKRAQYDALAVAVRETLLAGLAAGGATIDDFRHADGVSGAFQNEFLVHRRRGEGCPACGGEIVKFVAAGRGTYACEHCQPRPRVRRSRPRGRAARA